MGYVRVSQRFMTDRVLNDLRFQVRTLLDLQEQLSTGHRINKPSDDPIDCRRAIDTRTIIQKSEQYGDNMAMTMPQHLETSTILDNITQAIIRAHELTLQGANGANAQEQLDLIAEEINQVLEGVLENANHQTNGRYIFAGTRTLTAAFEATRNANGDITQCVYRGDGNYIDLEVADGVRIAINEPGSRVFQAGTDIFELLVNIRDDLLAGNRANLNTVRLDELEGARSQLLRAQARVGAAQNRVERAQNENEDYILANEELQSLTIDADYASTVVEANVQQNAYRSALQAASRVLQPSLMDFVR